MAREWPACPRCQSKRVRPRPQGRQKAVAFGLVLAFACAGVLWPVAWLGAVILLGVAAWPMRGQLECQDCFWHGRAP